MKIYLSIDIEQDCPPFLNTWRGLEEGLPLFLDLLAEQKIQATCFATGESARRYPHLMQRIVNEGHELGCHGDTHRRFDQMDETDARLEIERATQTLRQFDSVLSFRAPNLQFPQNYVRILEENGYKIDSSLARYKLSYYRYASIPTGLKRIPTSATSFSLRLPAWIKQLWYQLCNPPLVLFVHPWEFVDLSKTSLRWDCRWGTGAHALQSLKETIAFFKNRGFQFLRMKDYL